MVSDQRLGNGSVGAVYLARDLKSNRQLACKVHNFDKLRTLERQQQAIRRVNNESNILGKLKHVGFLHACPTRKRQLLTTSQPNILKFEYAFRSQHTLYTFVELATGGDLFSTVLYHRQGVPPQLARLILYQIVRAVRHLHKHNLTHRDLKPENIFFADGPSGNSRVIVGDLGFATGTT